MLVDVFCCTRRGVALGRRLVAVLGRSGEEVRCHAPANMAGEDVLAFGRMGDAVADAFVRSDALVFVCACGIAVRTIAPHVRDKFRDPAVVCVDDRGSFAIALLSGHVGGANELARRVAASLGAQAVITTATDANHVFSVDAWATGQGLSVLGRREAKLVSATLLDGGSVGLVSDVPIAGPVPHGIVMGEGVAACTVGICISAQDVRMPFEHTLRLVPQVLTVGVGCRRGTDGEHIAEVVDECLAQSGYLPEAVCRLATIDIKADEVGISELACERGWEVRLSSADELARVPGAFASSDFVLRTVGVGNVCERAACAGGERLLVARTSSRGVTVALGALDVSLAFDESAAEGGGLS